MQLLLAAVVLGVVSFSTIDATPPPGVGRRPPFPAVDIKDCAKKCHQQQGCNFVNIGFGGCIYGKVNVAAKGFGKGPGKGHLNRERRKTVTKPNHGSQDGPMQRAWKKRRSTTTTQPITTTTTIQPTTIQPTTTTTMPPTTTTMTTIPTITTTTATTMGTTTTSTTTNTMPTITTTTTTTTATQTTTTTNTPLSTCVYNRGVPPTKLPSVIFPLYDVDIQHDPVTQKCTDSYFLEVAKGCSAVLAIVNVGGMAPEPNTSYSTGMKICLKHLSDAGVRTVGYVATKLATMDPDTGVWYYSGVRNMTTIKGHIDTWVNGYLDIPLFQGIFVDEVSSIYDTVTNRWGVDHLSFYYEIINYIKTTSTNGGFTILNGGTVSPLEFMVPSSRLPFPADVSVAFEQQALSWRPPNNNCATMPPLWTLEKGSYNTGPWCPFVPEWDGIDSFKTAAEQGQFAAAALVFEANATFAMNEAAVAKASGLQYFYATDRTLISDPWAGVPSYWLQYLTHLNNNGI